MDRPDTIIELHRERVQAQAAAGYPGGTYQRPYNGSYTEKGTATLTLALDRVWFVYDAAHDPVRHFAMDLVLSDSRIVIESVARIPLVPLPPTTVTIPNGPRAGEQREIAYNELPLLGQLTLHEQLEARPTEPGKQTISLNFDAQDAPVLVASVPPDEFVSHLFGPDIERRADGSTAFSGQDPRVAVPKADIDKQARAYRKRRRRAARRLKWRSPEGRPDPWVPMLGLGGGFNRRSGTSKSTSRTARSRWCRSLTMSRLSERSHPPTEQAATVAPRPLGFHRSAGSMGRRATMGKPCETSVRRWVPSGIPVLMSLALAATVGLGWPAPAAGAVSPIAWLIENGGQFTSYTRADGLTVWVSSDRPIFAIVNGQKTGAAIGRAVIYVWQDPVPASFAGSFGPFAGLGILTFFQPGTQTLDFTAHLGLLQTATGALLTTIGVGSPSNGIGAVDPTVAGAWALGDPASIGGAQAQDLVIVGLWVSNTPVSLGALQLDACNTVCGAPPGDLTPTTMQVVSPSCGVNLCVADGVYNALAQLGVFQPGADAWPVRAFTAESIFQGQDRFAGHLLVIHTGVDEYAVVACSGDQGSFWSGNFPIADGYTGCTLSGTGPFAGLSGSVDYQISGGFPSAHTPLAVTASQVAP